MGIFSEYKTVQRLLAQRHPIIFFAENKYYYQYFEQLITVLLQRDNQPVLYITADESDPLLMTASPGLTVVYIHWWLGFLFPRLKADTVIMTMTDLDNYIFKRSKNVECYIYIFHAIVSTHQQYSTKAFYHYDAVFCPGAAHRHELREAERIYRLPAKDLIDYGYPLTDMLQKKNSLRPAANKQDLPVILIAPSWYEQCIFETCLEELVIQLAPLPYKTVIRPHPEYLKRRKKKMAGIEKLSGKNSRISFDYTATVSDALLDADILITDRSGIAFEYALGIQKPVLFIDTPLKIMNPSWRELEIEPLESQMREKMGISLSPAMLSGLAQSLELLKDLQPAFPAQMEQLQKKILFNSNTSCQNGIDYIISKIRK